MDGARRRELREVGREDRGGGSRQGSRKRVRNVVGTGKKRLHEDAKKGDAEWSEYEAKRKDIKTRER